MLDANWNAGYVAWRLRLRFFFSSCFLLLLSLFAALGDLLLELVGYVVGLTPGFSLCFSLWRDGRWGKV